MDVGEKIQEYRIRKGYTQKKLAELSGIPASTISKIENYRADELVAPIIKIANALEVEPYIFLVSDETYNANIKTLYKLEGENLDKLMQKPLVDLIREVIKKSKS